MQLGDGPSIIAEPTVSIVIPCYNYGRFLHEAVESALAQTRPADEIIIINDGSSDNTHEVAQRYTQYPVARYIRQDNQGAIAAFNKGIESSTGEFFAVLSADDRLDHRFLERTVPHLVRNPAAGYVYTGYQCFGLRQSTFQAAPFDRARLAREPYISGTSLMRRAAFVEAGGYSSAMRAGYEDWDLYITLAERGWYGSPLREILFQYRLHAESRNSMSVRTWLSLMRQLYERHPCMRSFPLAVFLGRAVIDRAWKRIVAAPQQHFDHLGSAAHRPGDFRACMLVSNTVKQDVRVRREAKTVAEVLPLTVLGQGSEGTQRVTRHSLDNFTVLLMPRRGQDFASGVAHTGQLPAVSTVKSLAILNWRLAIQAYYQHACIYHAHDLDTLPAAACAAILNRSTLVYDSHELWPEMSTSRERKHAWSTLERLLMMRVDRLITINRSIADELCRKYGKQATVLHNYPDVSSEVTPPANGSQPWSSTEKIVVRYHGVFLADRGLEELIRAVPLLHPRIVVNLQGYGPIERELQQLTTKLGLLNRVSFLGPVSGKEMIAAARKADVGVVLTRPTSLNHRLSTPNKVYEYLQAGLALVVSDLPEMRTIIEETCAGLTCNSNDPASIADAINHLALDRRYLLEMRESARAAALCYRWDAEAPALVSLYKYLLIDKVKRR